MNGEQHGRASKVKILIVEDQMPVAMMMTFLLARAGCETEVATTGANAMQKAQDGNFDLITLDADLPGISGFEVCRRLKENPFFQTPIVFVSGRCCIEDQQHGLDVGAADYITKPFETFEFAPRLLSHIKTQHDSVVMEAHSMV
ncbi:MAG: response regulator [Verrucomicrobiia bacterium]|jgi:DNA-binding response OmpR family regulator